MEFGRNQVIGIGALLVPFLTATGFVLGGKMTAAEWAGFVQWIVPTLTATVLGAGAVVKVWSKPGAPEAPQPPPEA